MSEIHSSIPAGSRPIEQAPGYRVCNDGVVWSNRGRNGVVSWHIKKPHRLPNGYLKIFLQINGIEQSFYVHHLVLEAFVGPCPDGMECRHFPDRDRANNRVENLNWGTPAQNTADKKIHGTLPVGDKASWSILKEADIPEIFRLFRSGVTYREIARIYGVSLSAIAGVIRRKTWSHVNIDEDLIVRFDSKPSGNRVGTPKLKEADIPEIFRLSREGLTQERIASIYGVTFGAIGHVLRRLSWSHVSIEPIGKRP